MKTHIRIMRPGQIFHVGRQEHVYCYYSTKMGLHLVRSRQTPVSASKTLENGYKFVTQHFFTAHKAKWSDQKVLDEVNYAHRNIC